MSTEKLSDDEIEGKVGDVVATMKLAGFTPTEIDIETCRKVARGEITSADVVAEVIEKLRKDQEADQ